MSTPFPITNDTVRKSYEVLAILAVCEVACGEVRKYHVGEDAGNIGMAISVAHRMAGEVHDVVEAHALAASRPARRTAGTAADPIFAAFARMDTASAALDGIADSDTAGAQTDAALKAWELTAMEAAGTAPTTKAGLITLLERLAADIERGPSVWQKEAADTAAAAAHTLLEGGPRG